MKKSSQKCALHFWIVIPSRNSQVDKQEKALECLTNGRTINFNYEEKKNAFFKSQKRRQNIFLHHATFCLKIYGGQRHGQRAAKEYVITADKYNPGCQCLTEKQSPEEIMPAQWSQLRWVWVPVSVVQSSAAKRKANKKGLCISPVSVESIHHKTQAYSWVKQQVKAEKFMKSLQNHPLVRTNSRAGGMYLFQDKTVVGP